MVKKTSILSLLSLSILFSGCTPEKPEISFEKPEIQVPKKVNQVKRNKGSLYSVQGASLFADKKDLQIGDIIQIIISEDLQSNSNNKRELSSDRSSSLGGGLFTGTNGNTLGGLPNKAVNELNGNLGIDFNTESSSADKGTVKTQFTETFSTTISAIIEETYQNGNYFIKGSKELLIEGQKQKIIVTGVIRPYDITSDNSVNSGQIANLKVLYDKEGVEADVLETPWGTKFLRKIWPF